MRRLPVCRDAALVLTAALALFASTATAFDARPTDLSALRVLSGDIPYRDFWTMYAPGSFGTLAVAYAIFGRELLVSNLLGIATSVAAVGLFHRIARKTCGVPAAMLLAGLVMAALFGTGYDRGFTSYPPAFLLILAALHRTAGHAGDTGARWAVVPGLLLGTAVLFKHDVGGYALIAVGLAVAVARRPSGVAPVWIPALALGAAAAAVIVSAAAVLVMLGAGRAAWDDLVRFPLTDFKYVRPEYFPLVPHWQSSVVETVRDFRRWAICNLPLVALAFGVAAIWRRRDRLDTRTAFLATFASIAFWFHWAAAHVQINTHAISLAAWGGLVGAIGLSQVRRRSRASRALSAGFVIFWGALFVAEPASVEVRAMNAPSDWVLLPHLRGIRLPSADVQRLRGLAAAIAAAGDPAAPLLFLSARNDIDVYASPAPFWLTDRRPATRHHELHPGVTDTVAVQRQMLDDLAREPAPVVVREHRFDDRMLDSVKAEIVQHVAIGSTLIDAWVDRYYEAGPSFGVYEVMRRRTGIGKAERAAAPSDGIGATRIR